MRSVRVWLLVMVVLCLAAQKSSAEVWAPPEETTPSFAEMGFSVGYSLGELDLEDESGSYQGIPLSFWYGYNPQRLLEEHLDWTPRGSMTLVVEPFFTPVSNPNEELEVGVALRTRYHFQSSAPLRKASPYVDIGLGGIYTTINWEYSTQLNFLCEAGVGAETAANPGSGLAGEKQRLSHLRSFVPPRPAFGGIPAPFPSGTSPQWLRRSARR